MMKLHIQFVAVVVLATLAMPAFAQSESADRASAAESRRSLVWSISSDVTQSSSLYLQRLPQAPPIESVGVRPNRMSPYIASASLMAVNLPEPRRYAINDLVEIIIRESTQADAESALDTEKKSEYKGELKEFPNLNISDLLNLQLKPSKGLQENPVKLDLKYDSKFESDGEYYRSDSFVGRVAARIIDVKPNGTLVLEARKYIKNDDEELVMRLTGTCRKDDIAADNTIRSTQLYDLRLVKEHSGELRKTTKKGILTNLMDAIFNF